MKVYKSVNRVSGLEQSNSILNEMLTILAYNRENYAQPVKGLEQLKIISVNQDKNSKSGTEVPISLYFKNNTNFRIAVKNGDIGLRGRQGKTGPEGDKGANFEPNYNISNKWLVIANDRVTDDDKKVLSALQGVKMAEQIEALSETYLSEYQYALLFTDHITIETEFETIEDGQLVQLIGEDQDSHKRYVKYWTFESEGAQEYFVLNHFASIPAEGDKPAQYSYDSVYCDLWEDIFLGGREGFFEATTNQLIDGSLLYIYDSSKSEYVLIEQYDKSRVHYDEHGNRINLNEYDLVYGERRFKYYLKSADCVVSVKYQPLSGYDFNLDATELVTPIYVFDKIVDDKLTYKLIDVKLVDPKGTETYYTIIDNKYEQIDDVESFIQKKPTRYYKKSNDDKWVEVESLSKIDTAKFEEYIVAEFDKNSNITKFTHYKSMTTFRDGTFYVSSFESITPYTIVYYIYDNDRQYFTRRIFTTTDKEGNIVFDYEYTPIKIPFWLEAEFLTDSEDMRVRLLSSDTHYDSDEEIVEPIYIESIEFAESEITIAKNMNKNVPVMIFPENANQTGMYIDYDENVIELFEDGRIAAIESDNISVDTTISVCSEKNETIRDTLTVHVVTPVERIEFDEEDVNVYPGTSTQIKYSIYPEVVSNSNVTFEISDKDMIVIDKNNNISTKIGLDGKYKTGRCTITATANDGFGASSILNVLVADPIEAIKITSRNFGFVGKPFDIETEILPVYATETHLDYSSLDEDILVIDNKGTITPKAIGEATIYAKSIDGSNKVASQTIKVTIGVDEIKLNNFDIETLDVGLSKDIIIEVVPETATSKEIKIIVSNEEVIEYTPLELIEGTTNKYKTTITAIKNGTTQFAVQALDGTGEIIAKDLAITVPVGEISLNNTQLTMYVGDDFTLLRPIIGPAETTNQTIEWHTSNDIVASVDSQGRVTPNAPGTAIISAISTDGNGVVASCTVTVKTRVKDIILNNSDNGEIEVVVENYAFINAKVIPDSASDQVLRWMSSNENIVTVEDNGTVYGKAIGEATITVTSTDLGDSPATKSIVVKVVDKISK